MNHSSIVVFDIEFEYGPDGVQIQNPKNRKPEKTIRLGFTFENEEDLYDYVDRLRHNKYRKSNYKAVTNNCHKFCNDLSVFLTGIQIPSRYLYMGDYVKDGTLTVAKVVGVVTTGMTFFRGIKKFFTFGLKFIAPIVMPILKYLGPLGTSIGRSLPQIKN